MSECVFSDIVAHRVDSRRERSPLDLAGRLLKVSALVGPDEVEVT